MLMTTVLSAAESLRAADVDGEVFIVENSDEECYLAALDCLAGQIKDGVVRVAREANPSMAVAIDRCHRKARGEYILWLDAHCLIGHGTIEALLDFAERHQSEPIGFVHAPIQWAHRSATTRKTHFDLQQTRLGAWGGPAVAAESRVTWKGMPYLIRRDVYEAIGGLGCLAEHRAGWGILRYLGIKPWLMGYENWAIPAGVVYHFGEWPESARKYAKYRTYQRSGDVHPGWPYAVAAYVLGGEEFLRQEYEPAAMGRYFHSVDQAVAEAKRIGEADRRWVLEHQTRSLQDLLANPPWQTSSATAAVGPTISDQYRALNAALHADPTVLYGYKGAEQAETVKAIAKQFGVASILDFGAGKQSLSKALRSIGCKDVRDYDPAIPAIATAPEPADLVVCNDVLEHCEPELLDNVLETLRRLARKAVFIRVCTIPCTSKALPDGSDPHRIVRDRAWWMDRLQGFFDPVRSVELSEKYFSLIARPRAL